MSDKLYNIDERRSYVDKISTVVAMYWDVFRKERGGSNVEDWKYCFEYNLKECDEILLKEFSNVYRDFKLLSGNIMHISIGNVILELGNGVNFNMYGGTIAKRYITTDRVHGEISSVCSALGTNKSGLLSYFMTNYMLYNEMENLLLENAIKSYESNIMEKFIRVGRLINNIFSPCNEIGILVPNDGTFNMALNFQKSVIRLLKTGKAPDIALFNETLIDLNKYIKLAIKTNPNLIDVFNDEQEKVLNEFKDIDINGDLSGIK